MTIIDHPNTTKYDNLPSVSPIGAPLDWKWLRGAKSEWGVKPKPGPRGLTMMDVAVGSYGDVPDNPPHRSMAPRGADVDPARYGEEPGPETERPSAARDEAEFTLTRDALATDVPLFAICRGFQVLNVVAGGTLLQHLEQLEPHRPRQRDDSGVWESGWHDVEVAPGTLLARLTGAPTLRVNSRHHQAVTPERLAPGLVADGRTDEGGVAVIEAVEVIGHPFALGVQWHPERAEMQDDAALEAGAPRLFSAFLDAARMRQDARDGNARSSTSA
ncbi:MAG: gamma-glutamyl-gamma-aminobutyrate hydrolase family protein [Chloroflexota bacterium]